MTEIVGPDDTRYKIIRNPLPDPQDYGWLEPYPFSRDVSRGQIIVHEVRRETDNVLLLRHLVDTRLGFEWGFPDWRPVDPWYEAWLCPIEETPFTTCRHPDQGVPP